MFIIAHIIFIVDVRKVEPHLRHYLDNRYYGYLTRPHTEWKDLSVYESQTSIFELYKKITNKGIPYFGFSSYYGLAEVNSKCKTGLCYLRSRMKNVRSLINLKKSIYERFSSCQTTF